MNKCEGLELMAVRPVQKPIDASTSFWSLSSYRSAIDLTSKELWASRTGWVLSSFHFSLLSYLALFHFHLCLISSSPLGFLLLFICRAVPQLLYFTIIRPPCSILLKRRNFCWTNKVHVSLGHQLFPPYGQLNSSSPAL